MPRTTKREKRPTERLAPVPDAVLDHFTPDRPMTAEEIDAAGQRLKKALMERMLGGELSYHLGYPPGGTKPEATTSHRNGTSEKRVLTGTGRSSRSGFRSTPAGWRALTTRCWPCMRAA